MPWRSTGLAIWRVVVSAIAVAALGLGVWSSAMDDGPRPSHRARYNAAALAWLNASAAAQRHPSVAHDRRLASTVASLGPLLEARGAYGPATAVVLAGDRVWVEITRSGPTPRYTIHRERVP